MRVVGSSWKFYVYVYTAQDRISAKGKPLLGYSPSATLSLFSYCLSRNRPEVKCFFESFNFVDFFNFVDLFN